MDTTREFKLEKEDTEALVGSLAEGWMMDPFKMSRKFFEILCGLAVGEATTIVRRTCDKFGCCGLGSLDFLSKRDRT